MLKGSEFACGRFSFFAGIFKMRISLSFAIPRWEMGWFDLRTFEVLIASLDIGEKIKVNKSASLGW